MSVRSFAFLLLLASCSLGVTKTGGEQSYIYDVYSDYTTDDLKTMSSKVVTTLVRDPQQGKINTLFTKTQPPIKKIGVLVFDTKIQETRSGLSGLDKVYLSEQGKQLLTERMASIWDQSIPLLAKDLNYFSISKIKKSKSLKIYGSDVSDYIHGKRGSLDPDDIFYLPSGKKTTTTTVLNPRRMRDLSLALVPASELMAGPKFSEHMKHAVNDVTKEFGLDAVLVVMSDIFWTASHFDKHSGNFIPEELTLKINASVLIPFSNYHKRLENLGEKRDLPRTTVAYRAYESSLKIPILLSVPPEEENFQQIERELLNPMLKTYKDLLQMVILKMDSDLRETHL